MTFLIICLYAGDYVFSDWNLKKDLLDCTMGRYYLSPQCNLISLFRSRFSALCSTGYVLSQYGRLSSFFLVYKEKPYRAYLYDFVALQTLVSLYRTENCSRLSRVFLIRCPWDSNPRTEVLQTCTIDHSVRAP